MKTFFFNFKIDGPTFKTSAADVTQARLNIVEQCWKEAYVVWEPRHGL